MECHVRHGHLGRWSFPPTVRALVMADVAVVRPGVAQTLAARWAEPAIRLVRQGRAPDRLGRNPEGEHLALGGIRKRGHNRIVSVEYEQGVAVEGTNRLAPGFRHQVNLAVAVELVAEQIE